MADAVEKGYKVFHLIGLGTSARPFSPGRRPDRPQSCTSCALTFVYAHKVGIFLIRGRPLIGRDAECSELDSLLEALRRGESR